MIDILKIFRAGFVNRWHTNPDLAHTNDRIDGHSARVARIILALHPDPSVNLIAEALTHDDGESVVGDVPFGFKSSLTDESASKLAALEQTEKAEIWTWKHTAVTTSSEFRWIKFADRLDAYMWAAHHAPHVLNSDDWPEAREWLRREAERLGAERGFDAICDMEASRHAVA